MSEKRCSRCLEPKPLDSFYRDPRGRCGVTAKCRQCHMAETTEIRRRKQVQRPTLDEKIDSRIRRSANGCHEWTGALTTAGYGLIRLPGHDQPSYAHRVVYERSRGAIPNGLQIDHLCRNRRCVNPDHLEVVTGGENIRRAWQWKKANYGSQ